MREPRAGHLQLAGPVVVVLVLLIGGVAMLAPTTSGLTAADVSTSPRIAPADPSVTALGPTGLTTAAGALPSIEDGLFGANRNFTVTANGSAHFVLDGRAQPPLTLVRGKTYTFAVDAPGHPFHISEDATGGDLSGIYTDGVSVTNHSTQHQFATDTGTLRFTVPDTAPDTLYYVCANHGGMGAQLTIVDDGSGTRSDRRMITDAAELQAMENDPDGHYELANDIDASVTATWNDGAGFDPVGTFTGSLHGEGHTIAGLTVNRSTSSNVGLFSYLVNGPDGNDLYEFTLESPTVVGSSYVGPIAGSNSGATVNAVHVHNATVNGTSSVIGGAFGRMYNDNADSDIESVYENSIVSVTIDTDASYIGGVAGRTDHDSGGTVDHTATVDNVTVDANLTGGTHMGGVFGYTGTRYGRGDIQIYDITVTGSIRGQSQVGGMVGYVYGTSLLAKRNVINADIVGSDDYIGGVVGRIFQIGADDTTYPQVEISETRATGNVTGGDNYIGGFIGQYDLADRFEYASRYKFNDNYATGTVRGDSGVGGMYGALLIDDNVRGSQANIYHNDNYATGDVYGTTNLGGYFGFTEIDRGIYSFNMRKNYAAGAVYDTDTLSDRVGGFVGAAYGDSCSQIELSRYQDFTRQAFWVDTTVGDDATRFIGVEAGSCDEGYFGYRYRPGTTETYTGEAYDPDLVDGTFDYWYLGWDSGTTRSNGYQVSLPVLEANTQPRPWPEQQTYFANGSGSASNPYIIENWRHLSNVDLVDYDSHFLQVTDLNASTPGYDTYAGPQANDGAGWQPLFTSQSDITYDGDGHTISDLYINRSAVRSVNDNGDTIESWRATGLFGALQSGDTVTNVTFTDATVTMSANRAGTAILAGEINGDGDVTDITLRDSTVTGYSQVGAAGGEMNADGDLRRVTVENVSVTARNGRAGGVIGQMYYETGLLVDATVTNTTVTGGGAIGGAVGNLDGSSSGIPGGVVNVTVTGGVVNGTGSSYVGGVIGQAEYYDRIENITATVPVTGSINVGGAIGGLLNLGNGRDIRNATASGAVIATTRSGGGLIGGATTQDDLSSPPQVYDSSATGTVSGGSDLGGLVGSTGGGRNTDPIGITRSYATGDVNGTATLGGLIGEMSSNGPGITDSYATGDVTGTGTNVGGLAGTGLSPITRSYATGAVNGTGRLGGLVGYGRDVSESYATGNVTGTDEEIGGLVGYLTSGTLEDVYAAGGVVTGDTEVGGLVGYSFNNNRIDNAYAAMEVHAQTSERGGFIGYDRYDAAGADWFWVDVSRSDDVAQDESIRANTDSKVGSGDYQGLGYDPVASPTDDSVVTPLGNPDLPEIDGHSEWIVDVTETVATYPYLVNNVPDPKPGTAFLYGSQTTQPSIASTNATAGATLGIAEAFAQDEDTPTAWTGATTANITIRSPLQYDWQLMPTANGSGTTVNRSGEQIALTAATPGVYDLTLTVADAMGTGFTETTTVRVNDITPPVPAVATNASAAPSLAQDHTQPEYAVRSWNASGSTDNVQVDTYAWQLTADDLTDGTDPASVAASASGAVVTFAPAAPGNYTVALTVTDTSGNVNTTARSLRVTDVSPRPALTSTASRNITAAPVIHTLDTSSYSQSHGGIVWNDDGTKLYIADYWQADVESYELSTPYDLSTAAHANTYTGARSGIAGIAWDDDGTRLYQVPYNDDGKVYVNEVAAPYDLTTVGSGRFYDLSGSLPGNDYLGGIEFGPDGSTVYFPTYADDSVVAYALSTPYDLSTREATPRILDVDASGAEGYPYGVEWLDGGTTLWVMGYIGGGVGVYDVTAPYDVSTATKTGEFEFAGVARPGGIVFDPTLSTVYVPDYSGDDVTAYEVPLQLETPSTFDATVSTPTPGSSIDQYNWTLAVDGGDDQSFAGGNISIDTVPVAGIHELTLTVTDARGDIAARTWAVETTAPTATITTNASGGGGDQTYEQPEDATRRWDGSASSDAGEVVAFAWQLNATDLPDGTDPASVNATATGENVTFAPATPGNYTVSLTVTDAVGVRSTTTTTLRVEDVSPRPAFTTTAQRDLSSAPVTQTLDVGAATDQPSSLVWDDDGSTLYVAGAAAKEVQAYELSDPYNLSTASAGDVFSWTNTPSGVAWNEDGTQLYLANWDAANGGPEVYRYSIDTPYDLSTRGSGTVITLSNYPGGRPSALEFSPDGSQLYLATYTDDEVVGYELSTPYDATTHATSPTILEIDGTGAEDTPHGIEWLDGGTTLWVLGYTGGGVGVYDVTTPYDLSTANRVGEFDLPAVSTPGGVVFDPTMSTLYVPDYSGDDVTALEVPLQIEVPSTFDGGVSVPIAGSSIAQYDWTVQVDGGTDRTYTNRTITLGGLNGTAATRLDLQVTDATGDVATRSWALQTTQPTPALTANATVASDPQVDFRQAAGAAVRWDGSGSTDPGSVDSYEWTFQADTLLDGTDPATVTTVRTGANVTYTPAIAGTYTVTLEATDAVGIRNATSATLRVVDATDPVAAITTDAASGETPGSFTQGAGIDTAWRGDTSTDNFGIASYAWRLNATQLDDGTIDTTSINTTASGASVTFGPTPTGSYVVTLTVTDRDGNTNTTEATLAVVDETGPTVRIDTDATSTDTGYTQPQLTTTTWSAANSTDVNAITTVSWELRAEALDNTSLSVPPVTATGETANFTPPEPGSYTLTVAVSDAYDNTNTTTRTLSVTDTVAPTARYTTTAAVATDSPMNHTQPRGVERIYRANASTDNGRLTGFEWWFNATDLTNETVPLALANETGFGESVAFTPQYEGNYSVRLIVSDADGNTDTAQTTLQVTPPPAPRGGGGGGGGSTGGAAGVTMPQAVSEDPPAVSTVTSVLGTDIEVQVSDGADPTGPPVLSVGFSADRPMESRIGVATLRSITTTPPETRLVGAADIRFPADMSTDPIHTVRITLHGQRLADAGHAMDRLAIYHLGAGDDTWERLPTTRRADGQTMVLSAPSVGFSVYAVFEELPPSPSPAQEPLPVVPDSLPDVESSVGFDSLLGVLVFLLIAALAAVGLMARRSRGGKPPGPAADAAATDEPGDESEAERSTVATDADAAPEEAPPAEDEEMP